MTDDLLIKIGIQFTSLTGTPWAIRIPSKDKPFTNIQVCQSEVDAKTLKKWSRCPVNAKYYKYVGEYILKHHKKNALEYLINLKNEAEEKINKLSEDLKKEEMIYKDVDSYLDTI